MDIDPGAAPPAATSTAEVIAWVGERLRSRGERMTRSRASVITALGEHPGQHLTVEDVHRAAAVADPTLHLSSVYRTLEALCQLGVVQHIHLGHGATAYHLSAIHGTHLHAQCARCGAVLDLPGDLLDDVAARLAAELRFTLDATHVALSGLCADCSDARGADTHAAASAAEATHPAATHPADTAHGN